MYSIVWGEKCRHFFASAQRLWFHNLCSLIKSWLSFKGCHTCTHHGPILIYTSSGQLDFKCYFLYFSISIATNNIVGRMLTFNHYQFIHYFNLLALHCNVVVRHQLNCVTLQWKRYHFKRLDNTHGFKKKILAPNCQFPFLHCTNFNIAWSFLNKGQAQHPLKMDSCRD